MLKVYRENGGLYVESKLQMKHPVEINGNVYSGNKNVSFEELDTIHKLLRRNAKVLINIDDKFVKPDLYEFEMTIANKKYNVVDGLPSMVDKEKSEALDWTDIKSAPEINEEIAPIIVEEEIDENEFNKNEQKPQNNNYDKRDKKRNRHSNSEQPQVKGEEGDR